MPTAEPNTPQQITTHQIIVMGVSGVGKTTIARGIAEATGWDFAEGDDMHPQANVDKMAAGIPLNDDDRWPWLHRIGEWLDAQIAAGRSSVVTCSALRRSYRDLLRENRPQVRFLDLIASEDLIAERIKDRHHRYMPASLLQSQFDTLEPLQPAEPGVKVSVEGTPAVALESALRALGIDRRAAS